MLDNKMVFQYIVFFSLGLLINAQFTAPFSIEKAAAKNLLNFATAYLTRDFDCVPVCICSDYTIMSSDFRINEHSPQ